MRQAEGDPGSGRGDRRPEGPGQVPRGVGVRRSRGPFGLVLEAIGKNLTNREYSEFGGEATFGGAPGYFPSPERSYVLGARLEFRR